MPSRRVSRACRVAPCVLLLAACAAPHRMYPGEPRSREEVARVHAGTFFELLAVDGEATIDEEYAREAWARKETLYWLGLAAWTALVVSQGSDDVFPTSLYSSLAPPNVVEVLPGMRVLLVRSMPGPGAGDFLLRVPVEAGREYRVELGPRRHGPWVPLVRELESGAVVLDLEPSAEQARALVSITGATEVRDWYFDLDRAWVVLAVDEGQGQVRVERIPLAEAGDPCEAAGTARRSLRRRHSSLRCKPTDAAGSGPLFAWSALHHERPVAGLTRVRWNAGETWLLTFERPGPALTAEETVRWGRTFDSAVLQERPRAPGAAPDRTTCVRGSKVPGHEALRLPASGS